MEGENGKENCRIFGDGTSLFRFLVIARAELPRAPNKEDLIPADLWPDLKGILSATIKVAQSREADSGVPNLFSVAASPTEISGDIDLWTNTLKDWRAFWKAAHSFPLVAIDTETSGLRPAHGSRIVGVSAAFWDGKHIQAGYWNLRHTGHAAHEGCLGYRETAFAIPIEELKCIEPIYRDCIVGGQNFKFDAKMGDQDGLIVPKRVLDTQLIAHLWNEMLKKYKLELLAKEMGEAKLHNTIEAYMAQHGLSMEGFGHSQVPYEIERPYAIMDVVLVLRRLQWERERWSKLPAPSMMPIFEIENACTFAYSKMEIAGMKLDSVYALAGVKALDAKLKVLEQRIYKEAGKVFGEDAHTFKILSNESLWSVLEPKGFKAVSLTPGDDPCLDDDNLAFYHDPLCDLVREYRGYHKTLGTYFRPFVENYTDDKGRFRAPHVDPKGFIHSDYFIWGTVTGRTSSCDPNLQNLTRAGKQIIEAGKSASAEDEWEVRRCFVPRGPDFSLAFFDYSQFELRMLAEYAGEESMIAAFDRDEDLHNTVAIETIPGCPDPKKDPKLFDYYRRKAKGINFGLVYGIGVAKLAISLDVPMDECVRLLELARCGLLTDPDAAKGMCTYSLDNIESILDDHRIMWQSRKYSGIEKLSREVAMRVNPRALEELLIRDGKNLRLKNSAKELMERYFKRFPKIKEFKKRVEASVRERGYIFNMYGRRYHLDRDKAYVGVNRLVQGTSGDMKKISAIKVVDMLEASKARTKLINDVHDELQLDLHHKELDLVPKIKAIMENFPKLRVKIKVDVGYSHRSWADKEKWVSDEDFLKTLSEFHLGVRVGGIIRCAPRRVGESRRMKKPEIEKKLRKQK